MSAILTVNKLSLDNIIDGIKRIESSVPQRHYRADEKVADGLAEVLAIEEAATGTDHLQKMNQKNP